MTHRRKSTKTVISDGESDMPSDEENGELDMHDGKKMLVYYIFDDAYSSTIWGSR